jgi:hypothetical protein
VELSRDKNAVENITSLIDDVLNLTDQDLSEWKFQYRKNPKEFDIIADNLKNNVPLTPEIYISTYGQEEVDDDEFEKDLDQMKNTAKVPNQKKAPVNDFTESLRVAAGLK